MKNRIHFTVSIIIAATFAFLFGMAEYSNNRLRRQIAERDAYLNYMDSALMSHGYIGKNDSSTFIIRPLDKYGHPTNLSGSDSIRISLEGTIELQDIIIKSAKRVYGFNYSYKIQGDSVSIKFWNRPKSQ